MALHKKAKIPLTAVSRSFKSFLRRVTLVTSQIPPTAVGGLFRSFLLEPKPGWFARVFSLSKGRREDLNDPQTAVCGIQRRLGAICSRKDLNDPLTAVSGIFAFCANPPAAILSELKPTDSSKTGKNLTTHLNRLHRI
jgi:hypothetical protein